MATTDEMIDLIFAMKLGHLMNIMGGGYICHISMLGSCHLNSRRKRGNYTT